jgi:hypothetical protein
LRTHSLELAAQPLHKRLIHEAQLYPRRRACPAVPGRRGQGTRSAARAVAFEPPQVAAKHVTVAGALQTAVKPS